jgi:hypothetical protein
VVLLVILLLCLVLRRGILVKICRLQGGQGSVI